MQTNRKYGTISDMKKRMKWITAILIGMLCVTQQSVLLYAEEGTPTPEVEETTEETVEEGETTGEITENGPEILAPSAILIDAKSGSILYQKNAHQKMAPASITKILTAYLAVRDLKPDTYLNCSYDAIFGFDRSSSHIWLDVDEQVRAEDAEYATIMASANDASNVLAEGISGSQEAFATYMNDFVAELGLTDTHFTNAHGLPDENHYTTAYDMAMITRVAIKNDTFKKIFGAVSWNMQPTNKQPQQRQLATGNEMLKGSKFFYEYATGGKIGWTDESGYTMVTTATYNNMSVIAVVLGEAEGNERYTDTQALFDWGFANYKTIQITQEQIQDQKVDVMSGNKVWATATFSIDKDFSILLPSTIDDSQVTTGVEIRNQEDPEKISGHLIFYLDGVQVGEQEMNKDIVVNDISFKATTLPLILNILDYASVGLLGLFVFGPLFLYIRKKTSISE